MAITSHTSVQDRTPTLLQEPAHAKKSRFGYLLCAMQTSQSCDHKSSCAPSPGQPKGFPVPSMTLSTDPASCWMWIMPKTLTLTTFPWGTGIHRQDQSVGKEEMESRNNVGVLSRAHKALALNTHQSWVKTANIYLCISLHK